MPGLSPGGKPGNLSRGTVTTSSVHELRDPAAARRFLLEGLWWQRVAKPAPAGVLPAFTLALELAASGQPLPPLGFIADVANAPTSGGDFSIGDDSTSPPGVPVGTLRIYEDHVLGKLFGDWTFSRAADALRAYQGRDLLRGLAFLIGQLRERWGIPGVDLSPGPIKSLLDSKPEQLLGEGWATLERDGPLPLVAEMYLQLTTAARRVGEALAIADVFELEHRTALAEPGERLALRQVIQAATILEAGLPKHAPRRVEQHAEVPTRVLDEDAYPVGGFSSLSTRGSVESLLHSQLAYMGPPEERPDLFDIKFLRDELLYYARDENQFLRRRRTYVFALGADLVATRFKDRQLPFQRGVLLLGLLVAAVARLTEWLTADALSFEILFPADDERLAAERILLQTILREPLAIGAVRLLTLSDKDLAAHGVELARRSQCHCLVIGVDPPPLRAADVQVLRLKIAGPRPALVDADGEVVDCEAEDASDSWTRTLEQVLARLV
jgi:hypothetical protein